jgi:hypothetical protein
MAEGEAAPVAVQALADPDGQPLAAPEPGHAQPPHHGQNQGHSQSSAPSQPPATIADGIALLHRVLQTPEAIPRWPMYIRNVKQAMRAVDPSFDERRHGNLVEILRAVQRDGVVRMERDRQGVLRVFQGPQLRPSAVPEWPAISDSEAAAIVGVVLDEPTDPAEADGQLAVIGPTPVAPVEEPEEAEDDNIGNVEQPVDAFGLVGSASTTGAKPRRRGKSEAAAPKAKSSAPRKTRTRTASPRKRKEPATE